MFNFKLPYFRLTPEGERLQAKIKCMKNYGKFMLNEFDGMSIDRNNKIIKKSYESFEVDSKSIDIFYNILTEKESQDAKDELKRIFHNKEIVYKELVCPYTNKVVQKFSVSYYGVFFKEKTLKLKIKDWDELLTVRVLLTGQTDLFNVNRKEINDYLKTAMISQLYSSEVNELMLAEWRFENNNRVPLIDLEIVSDDVDYVNVYYEDSTRFEKKRTYLSPKGFRFYKIKGKTKKIDTPEIKSFDDKLNYLIKEGLDKYRKKYVETDSNDKDKVLLSKISTILNDNLLSESTKINRIKDIVTSD